MPIQPQKNYVFIPIQSTQRRDKFASPHAINDEDRSLERRERGVVETRTYLRQEVPVCMKLYMEPGPQDRGQTKQQDGLP